MILMAEEILLKTALKQRKLTLNIVLNNTNTLYFIIGKGDFFLQVSFKLFKSKRPTEVFGFKWYNFELNLSLKQHFFKLI